MACIAINYSWLLILPRGTQGVQDNARVHLKDRASVSPWVRGGEGRVCRYRTIHPTYKRDCEVRKSLESHSRSSPLSGGQQVTLQLITKLERLRVSVSGSQTADR
ncbi:hypothetical protein NQZ68_014800 [Dissostichus eleginoides]|nr:hypothetical protein NQZ68_014800 [Dissostichus eleginoides]